MSLVEDQNICDSLLILCQATLEPEEKKQKNSNNKGPLLPEFYAMDYLEHVHPSNHPLEQHMNLTTFDDQFEVENQYHMKRKLKIEHLAAKRSPMYTTFYSPQPKPNGFISSARKDTVRNVELESIPAHLFGAFNAGDFHCLHDIIESITTPDMRLCTESLMEPLIGRRHLLSFFEALIDGHPDAFMICSGVRFVDNQTLLATINFKGTKALPSEKEFYFMKPRLVDNMNLGRLSHQDILGLVDLEYSLIAQNKPIEVEFVGTMTLIFDNDVHTGIEKIIKGPFNAFGIDNFQMNTVNDSNTGSNGDMLNTNPNPNSTLGEANPISGSDIDSLQDNPSNDSSIVLPTTAKTSSAQASACAVDVNESTKPLVTASTADEKSLPVHGSNQKITQDVNNVAPDSLVYVPKPEISQVNGSTNSNKIGDVFPRPELLATKSDRAPLCKCRISQVNFSYILKSFQEAIIPPVPPEVDFSYSRRI